MEWAEEKGANKLWWAEKGHIETFAFQRQIQAKAIGYMKELYSYTGESYSASLPWKVTKCLAALKGRRERLVIDGVEQHGVLCHNALQQAAPHFPPLWGRAGLDRDGRRRAIVERLKECLCFAALLPDIGSVEKRVEAVEAASDAFWVLDLEAESRRQCGEARGGEGHPQAGGRLHVPG